MTTLSGDDPHDKVQTKMVLRTEVNPNHVAEYQMPLHLIKHPLESIKLKHGTLGFHFTLDLSQLYASLDQTVSLF